MNVLGDWGNQNGTWESDSIEKKRVLLPARVVYPQDWLKRLVKLSLRVLVWSWKWGEFFPSQQWIARNIADPERCRCLMVFASFCQKPSWTIQVWDALNPRLSLGWSMSGAQKEISPEPIEDSIPLRSWLFCPFFTETCNHQRWSSCDFMFKECSISILTQLQWIDVWFQ